MQRGRRGRVGKKVTQKKRLRRCREIGKVVSLLTDEIIPKDEKEFYDSFDVDVAKMKRALLHELRNDPAPRRKVILQHMAYNYSVPENTRKAAQAILAEIEGTNN